MNVMDLIAPEAPIGGLMVSDTSVRAALRNPRRAKRGAPPLVLAEEAIPPGTIIEGALKDPAALTNALRRLLARTHGVSYFIVSIPPHGIYTKTLSFPRAVSGERLIEAVDLALGFQLPFSKEDAYVDYHLLPPSDMSRVFVATAAKSAIDAYQAALGAAGVRAVAIEPHTMSVARSHEGELALARMPYADSVVAVLLERGSVVLSRSLPMEHCKNDTNLEGEIARIEAYATVEYGTAPRPLSSKDMPIPASLRPHIGGETEPWVIALGALERALLPRSGDTLASLLPVGTEEAYAFQKAIAFSGFLRDMTAGIALFFIAAYAGTFAGLLMLRAQTAETLSTRAVSPASAELVAEEGRARAFNALLSTTATIASESPIWSDFFESLRASVIEGITITSISIEAPERPIRIAGIAATRAALNAFKDALDARGDLAEATLPLTNLELRADIPFTVTVILADPGALYPR